VDHPIRLDFRRTPEVSAGSFPEQRLVTEPILSLVFVNTSYFIQRSWWTRNWTLKIRPRRRVFHDEQIINDSQSSWLFWLLARRTQGWVNSTFLGHNARNQSIVFYQPTENGDSANQIRAFATEQAKWPLLNKSTFFSWSTLLWTIKMTSYNVQSESLLKMAFHWVATTFLLALCLKPCRGQVKQARNIFMPVLVGLKAFKILT